MLRLWTTDDHAAAFRATWPGLARDGLVSSELLRLEAERVCRRRPELRAVEADILRTIEAIAVIPLDRATLLDAGALPHAKLGALDAVHLATALRFGPELRGIVTYDKELMAAAAADGLEVVTPTSVP